VERTPAGTEASDGLGREIANGEQLVAATASVLTDLAVQRARRGTQLGHVAEHENAPAVQSREVIERRTDGTRIRVVAVVDERATALACDGSQPAPRRHGARES